MAFTLPDLPYDYNALEPYIDEQTMKLHHGKHHAGYVAKLNAALEGHPQLNSLTLEKLLATKIRTPALVNPIMNNAGGHANHSLFWEIMGPRKASPRGEPEGKLAEAIKSIFGSFESFKEKFTEKAIGVFGSGWAFLTVTKDKKLQLKRHSFQNSPLMHGNAPILALDVWEHAYYLKYQNRRDEYIKAWWNVVNWQTVSESFKLLT